MYSQQDGSRAFMGIVVAAIVFGIVGYIHLTSQVVELRFAIANGQSVAKVTSVAAAPMPTSTAVPTQQVAAVAVNTPIAQAMGSTNTVATQPTPMAVAPINAQPYGPAIPLAQQYAVPNVQPTPANASGFLVMPPDFRPVGQNNLPGAYLPELTVVESMDYIGDRLPPPEQKALRERVAVLWAAKGENPTRVTTRAALDVFNKKIEDSERATFNGASGLVQPYNAQQLLTLLRHVRQGYTYGWVDWSEMRNAAARLTRLACYQSAAQWDTCQNSRSLSDQFR